MIIPDAWQLSTIMHVLCLNYKDKAPYLWHSLDPAAALLPTSLRQASTTHPTTFHRFYAPNQLH